MFEKTQTDYEAMAQALASDGGALAAELNVHCTKMYEASKVGAHDQRCSITEDSNPEGHNQYTGGSAVKPGYAFAQRVQGANADRASKGLQTLSEGEAKAAASYTDGLYKYMNQPLRAGTSMGLLDQDIKGNIKALDSAIEKSPIKGDMELHRGMSAHATGEMFGKSGPQVGMVVKDNGFVSTSRDRQIVAEFEGAGGTHITVDAKAGQKALEAQRFSNAPEEHEVILPRGSQFTVTSVTRTPMGHNEVRVRYE